MIYVVRRSGRGESVLVCGDGSYPVLGVASWAVLPTMLAMSLVENTRRSSVTSLSLIGCAREEKNGDVGDIGASVRG